MGGSSNGPALPFYATFGCSAFSASFAEACTLPIDTAKVKLQLAGPGSKYKGLFGTLGVIAKEEGAAALWKGLGPGLHRQVLYGGLRIGLYDPIKDAVMKIAGEEPGAPVPIGLKIVAGMTTGAVGITVASPTDLVKVRMQAQGKLPPGTKPKYPSAFAAYGIIVKEEGVARLWTGLGPNVARNSIINAAELASYDQIKETLLSTPYFEEGPVTHIVSGLGAGFFAVLCGSPVDVVKSRMMGDTTGQYKGMADAFVKTATKDGVLAFYNGFLPNFARLGSWNVIMFLTLENMKKLAAEQLDK